jgi:hypothetical protein
MSNISLYTISCIGFDDQEQESISAILDLGHRALNCSWKLIDDRKSNVKIINLDNEAGSKIFSEKNNLSSCLVIWVATEEKSDFHWFLRKKKGAPPSLKELTQLLNEIELTLNESTAEAIDLVKITEPEETIQPVMLEEKAVPVIESTPEESIELVKKVELEEEVIQPEIADAELDKKIDSVVKDKSEDTLDIASVLTLKAEVEEPTKPVQKNAKPEPEKKGKPVEKKSPSNASQVKKENTEHNTVKKPEQKKAVQKKPQNKQKQEVTFDLDSMVDSGQQDITRMLTADNYLFGLLLKAKKDKKCRVIVSHQFPTLYLAPKKDSYYFSGTEEELIQLCLVDPQKFSCTMVTTAKFDSILKKEENLITFEGLDALIGYAVFNASQGRLLANLSAEKVVKLVQIPDAVKVPVLNRYEEISTLMHEEEMSLISVVEKLQVNLPYVFDYFNICYSLGYLKEVKAVVSENSTSNAKQKPFFVTFFKK